MERYVFSGSLTDDMVEYLQRIPEFEPMDVLVTQVARSDVKKMLEYKLNTNIIRSFFLDSGAYSIHTGKATADIDEYIEYANSIDEHCWAIAELDTIPGKFQQPKSVEDYAESAEKSWEAFLYMYPKMKSPEKLMAVFHYGEDIRYLEKMLAWRSDDGKQLDKLCLSPANDSGQNIKDAWLKNMYHIISKSCNPNIKTHLLGMTALNSLAKVPCYSADSVSHRLQAAYNKVYTRKWGVISISDRSRTSRSKSNMNFLEICDAATLKEFTDLIHHYGFTIDQLKNEPSARVAVNIVEIQQAIKHEYKYSGHKLSVPKQLFSLR